MNYDTFADWIHEIYSTQAVELDCDQTQALLPAYAEGRLAGRQLDSQYKHLQTHLSHCSHCQDVYQVLYHVLELEVTEGLPEVAELLAAFGTLAAVPEPLAVAL
ncbi:MAG: hypothetical protein AB1791_09820 [Chloroflexota bacterium]